MLNLIIILLAVLILPSVILIYFIPSFVAKYRNHHNFPAIFVLNLFFGWSFIGWGVALVWAVTRVFPTSSYVTYTAQPVRRTA